MPKLTEENKQELNEKIKYIGIDLDRIPDIIKNAEPLEYIPSKTLIDREYRVYRHIPVDDIQIVITSNTKGTDLKDKYKESSPIYQYLMPKEDESMDRYAAFLNMLQLCNKEGIEEIEAQQMLLKDSIPFYVKYPNNYRWEIYYAEQVKKYFMLVSTENQEYNELFYLLKKQFEADQSKKEKNATIFVPINLLNYSEEILTRQEIEDIGNYLWIFTNDWANIYEVYHENNNASIYIIGKTNVYENIKADYRIVLKEKEEANKFYKTLKALFVLQTEFNNYYQFSTQINSKSELEFYSVQDRTQKIIYEDLSQYIQKEHKKLIESVKKQDKDILSLNEELKELKETVSKKELEYLQKQREISTYLEYKKTFLGKVKYFFRSKKRKKKEEAETENNNMENIEEVNIDILEVLEKEKDLYNLYTIENLLTIYQLYKRQLNAIKNINLDRNSFILKIQNVDSKIKNASIYIDEINEHKKSIFEFWKFANKDEKLTLDSGTEVEDLNKEKIKAVFDYKTDIEDLGIKMDEIQRRKFSTEECNSIFLAGTNILHTINLYRQDKYVSIDMQTLKEELEQTPNIETIENYDIFGVILADRTKVKKLGNKMHREAEREKFRVLNLKKDTDIFEFKGNIAKAAAMLKESFCKVTTPIDLNIYILTNTPLEMNAYYTGELNQENIVLEEKQEEYYLYKIKVEEGSPLIFFTNIIYYDNKNNTLPLGMDKSTKVLIDCAKFEFEEISKGTFRTNQYIKNTENATNLKVKEINYYEYTVKLKQKED